MRRFCVFTATVILMTAIGPVHAQDVRFISPTGNIICNLNQYAAACVMSRLTPSFTDKPQNCDADWGRYFYVVAGQAGRLGCVTEGIEETATVLRYGQSLRAGKISCVSRRSGVTCRNSVGGGFSVRRSAQEVF